MPESVSIDFSNDIIQRDPNNTKKIVKVLNYASKTNLIENRKFKMSKNEQVFFRKTHQQRIHFSSEFPFYKAETLKLY